ncbi:MAG: T9SS type A sorting domain-containing protein, partial [Candidatus Cloacimonetes bacterium]|nr:T9SS type A sorting domain-containing protein [Candidatus Cloacimonadota bacterium]
RLDAEGNMLWVLPTGLISIRDISADNNGNCYATGTFNGSYIFGDTTLICPDESYNIFVAKIDSFANWNWAKQASGCLSLGISLCSNGNSYITGLFCETAIFGDITLTSIGYSSIFVAKLDGNGVWLWVTPAGSSLENSGYDIVADENGACYLTGVLSSPASFGTITYNAGVNSAAFIAKISDDGNWLNVAGCVGEVIDTSISIDAMGNSYIAGYYLGSIMFGDVLMESNGFYDMFVAKYGLATEVSDEVAVPKPAFATVKSYPNPFYGSTTFSIDVKEDNPHYELSVFDIRGRLLSTVYSGRLEKGLNTFTWDRDRNFNGNLPSGVYLYKFSDGINSITNKIILLK